MRWITLRQLKALRKLPVPPEALEAGRHRLLIVMADAPMAAAWSRTRAFIWKPAAVAMPVMAVFVAVFGGGAVYASQGALPGDALYTVKLASEGVREHLTLSTERKFAVQAEHAAERLEETRHLLEHGGLDAQERETRVRKAISGYEDRLTSMNEIAAMLATDPPKRGRGLKAMRAAERVLDRHAELVASATVTDPEVAEAVLEPIDDSIKLEDDVFTFTRKQRQDDGEKEDDADTERRWEVHRKERSDRLSGHLKRLRDELRQKPLEIKD